MLSFDGGYKFGIIFVGLNLFMVSGTQDLNEGGLTGERTGSYVGLHPALGLMLNARSNGQKFFVIAKGGDVDFEFGESYDNGEEYSLTAPGNTFELEAKWVVPIGEATGAGFSVGVFLQALEYDMPWPLEGDSHRQTTQNLRLGISF